MPSAPMFSVSQFTTWHQSFEQDVSLYSRLGVEGIEICERKLSTDPVEALDQLNQVKDAGLVPTSAQPRVHALFKDFMCPDLDDPDERTQRYRSTIDLFSQVFEGANLPLVAISGNAPGFKFRHAHETARRLYPPLADYAADRGLRIMYEPLSPILMNNDTFICTLDESIALIEDVDRENFGLMCDVWHLWREPRIAERLERVADRVFGVHISDWPAGEPRYPADRLVPGDGVIELAGLIGALHRGGYRGAYCLEIFSADDLDDSLWRQDPAGVIQRSREGLIRAWEASGCD